MRRRVAEPDRYRDLFSALDDGTSAVRGAGLSYCLASAASGVKTVSTKQFDRILAFDRTLRLITVEPGMTVEALSDFAVAHGCYFPVLPGHPSITIGGCAVSMCTGRRSATSATSPITSKR